MIPKKPNIISISFSPWIYLSGKQNYKTQITLEIFFVLLFLRASIFCSSRKFCFWCLQFLWFCIFLRHRCRETKNTKLPKTNTLKTEFPASEKNSKSQKSPKQKMLLVNFCNFHFPTLYCNFCFSVSNLKRWAVLFSLLLSLLGSSTSFGCNIV